MNDTKVWHEDDWFWETFGPVMFPQARWDAVPTEVDQVVALLGVPPGAAILDLGCGPGRHSLELARRGYRVTGVDRTMCYLEKAREKAQGERLDIEFVQGDMRRFVRPEGFDAVINLFTAFGYFEDEDEDRQVVANVYRSLKAGGVLVIHVMGKEVLARIFRPRDWQEIDGMIVVEDRKISRNWSWIENRWTLFKDGERHEIQLSHRIYSAAELAELLENCGFKEVTIYGDLAGAAYDHQAKRLVAVARK